MLGPCSIEAHLLFLSWFLSSREGEIRALRSGEFDGSSSDARGDKRGKSFKWKHPKENLSWGDWLLARSVLGLEKEEE